MRRTQLTETTETLIFLCGNHKFPSSLLPALRNKDVKDSSRSSWGRFWGTLPPEGGRKVDFFEHRMEIEWYRHLASLVAKKEKAKEATVHSLAEAAKRKETEMPHEERKAS
jgi:hypothetical protein